ncbi:Enolase [Capsicum chinense]|nr:Enolase [Capsicum chinense]
MILPVGASSFKEAMKSMIKKKYDQDAINVGDEDGFVPNNPGEENKKGLELLKTAIDKAGYTGKVVIGMDVAASEFYVKDKTYDLNFKERFGHESYPTTHDLTLQLMESSLYKKATLGYLIVKIMRPQRSDDRRNSSVPPENNMDRTHSIYGVQTRSRAPTPDCPYGVPPIPTSLLLSS